MRKLALVLLGAAIAFPLGALTRDARAELGRGMDYDVGYIHVEKADEALAEALAEIAASQRAQEAVWKDRRVSEARDALGAALHNLDVIVEGVRTNSPDALGPEYVGPRVVRRRWHQP